LKQFFFYKNRFNFFTGDNSENDIYYRVKILLIKIEHLNLAIGNKRFIIELFSPSPISRPCFFSLGFLFQRLHWGVVVGQFLTWNHPSSSFSLYFNLNKWFSHRSRFFFVILPSECGALLFVISCGIVWFLLLLRCSFDSYWKNNYSIKNLSINVADPEAWVFLSLLFYHIFLQAVCCEFVRKFILYIFSGVE